MGTEPLRAGDVTGELDFKLYLVISSLDSPARPVPTVRAPAAREHWAESRAAFIPPAGFQPRYPPPSTRGFSYGAVPDGRRDGLVFVLEFPPVLWVLHI